MQEQLKEEKEISAFDGSNYLHFREKNCCFWSPFFSITNLMGTTMDKTVKSKITNI